jgi:hypothetical protein
MLLSYFVLFEWNGRAPGNTKNYTPSALIWDRYSRFNSGGNISKIRCRCLPKQSRVVAIENRNTLEMASFSWAEPSRSHFSAKIKLAFTSGKWPSRSSRRVTSASRLATSNALTIFCIHMMRCFSSIGQILFRIILKKESRQQNVDYHHLNNKKQISF